MTAVCGSREPTANPRADPGPPGCDACAAVAGGLRVVADALCSVVSGVSDDGVIVLVSIPCVRGVREAGLSRAPGGAGLTSPSAEAAGGVKRSASAPSAASCGAVLLTPADVRSYSPRSAGHDCLRTREIARSRRRNDLMSATLVIAIVGALTGILGLAWQLVNFAWSGARTQLLAIRWRQEDGAGWWIETEVSNVGRLDATIVGYSVWADHGRYRRRRLVWRLRNWPGTPWRVSRRMLPVTAPSISVGSPGELAWSDETDRSSIELPALVKAGQTVAVPRVGLGWGDQRLTPHVAVQLGSGRFVVAEPLDASTLRPFETEL
jgi:hypothetical protein